ncbi:uncharacterized protein LOC127873576 [Dreissena polymorpha]|uniref:BTB domain-containing protein n=1 Tax=Dreissena polymorpha TaxID=45954 RepID=A0A9D4QUU2_DREPO|nr:uncharacterized protein LOC127873576 [Dreissena polymorpha]KAH3844304.1 hypothetical protein DPMN_086562 [Dreissena polymorpha]
MDEQIEMSDDSTLPEALYDQALNREEFCDITLEFGDTVMGGHWYVLVVQSGFFQAMYKTRLKEKQTGTVHITEGTHEAIKLAIKYLYTGNVTIDETHVEEILHISDYLQIRSLTDECNNYLTANTVWCPSNCWKLYTLAKRYRLNMMECLLFYIATNLKDIVGDSCYIKQITIKEAEELSIKLKCQGASLEGRLLFYHKWLSYDVENRKETFERWFCNLNLNESEHADFENVSKHYNLFQQFSTCLKYYLETTSIVLDCHLKKSLKTNIILALTRKDLNTARLCVYAYIINQNRWVFIATLPLEVNPQTITDVYIGVDEANSSLYAVSDSTYQRLREEGTDCIQTCYILVHKYDLIIKEWYKFEVDLNINEPNGYDIKGVEFLNNKVCIVVKSSSPYGDSVSVCRLETNDFCCSVAPLIALPANFKLVTVDSCVVDGEFIVVRCCYSTVEGTMAETMAVNHVSSFPIWPTAPALYTCSSKLPVNSEMFSRQRFMLPTTNGVIRSGISTSGYMYLNVILGLTSIVKDQLLPRHVFSRSAEVSETHSTQDCIVHGTSFNTVYIHNPSSNIIHVFDFSQRSFTEIPTPPGQLNRTKFVSAFLFSSVLTLSKPCPLCAFKQKANSR